MTVNSSIQLPIVKVHDGETDHSIDSLAIEEPLEISIQYGSEGNQQSRNISVTMRTPGNDEELAIGFLFTEGIIQKHEDIIQSEQSIVCAENKGNMIQLILKPGIAPNLNTAERNFYTTSSCGVCGKSSISSIKTVRIYDQIADHIKLTPDRLYALPDMLQKHQEVFADTGGLHASALFDSAGELVLVREDVGRHNALDKLIGAALKANRLPLNEHILLLSGRASFELVQKAAMAGIHIIAAVGAPSSLAVQLAEEFKITVVGFLRGKRFNIYSQPQRIRIPTYEDTY